MIEEAGVGALACAGREHGTMARGIEDSLRHAQYRLSQRISPVGGRRSTTGPVYHHRPCYLKSPPSTGQRLSYHVIIILLQRPALFTSRPPIDAMLSPLLLPE